ncbi:hypothetical protein INR49_024678 [Caranx melampygus]|nr:hypothetical protein INR49_024678 [Caranx melampygus]
MQMPGDSGNQVLQPNFYLYMPHLRQQPGSLKPNVVLGQGRGVSMVLGIPTVKRDKQSYLVSTLSSLLSGLIPSQQQDLLIIIFVAEQTDLVHVSSVAETIRSKFPKEVQIGLLKVISPSAYYYPDFSSLRETLGDSKDRVWRTKQNLDYSFLMLMSKQHRGKLFQTCDLPVITDFFPMFHRDKPIDWLLDYILWVKVCHLDKDHRHCDAQKAVLRQRYKPSLFQHMGLYSSLRGKVQQDKSFEKLPLFQAHQNAAAELSSSLKHYQQHSLDRAYRGLDFFWALTPIQGDHILISFHQPIHMSWYLFRSGNIETSGDKFYNTTVEVLPSKVPLRME